MEIYFDNAATTRLSPRAAARMERVAREHYGNASSLHLAGLRAEEELKAAAEEIAKTLKAEPRELIFTSGGTESDNLAILGTARSRKGYGRHLITSAVEHPAVLETMRFLEEQGFRLTVLPVDASGKISLSELEAAIQKDTVLVSLMYVNNEIGAIQPIAEAAALIHRLNPDCYFHVDAVQAYGKFEIYPKRLGIDMMSVSSHKIEGPKGVGFLYVNRRVSIKPASFGGGQQGGLRSGTLNVPGIAGMAEAACKGQNPCGCCGAPGGACKQCAGHGLGTADCKPLGGGGPCGSLTARPGGRGGLCVERFGLLVQSPRHFRDSKGHRPSGETPGCHGASQFLRGEYRGGGRAILRAVPAVGAETASIQTVRNRGWSISLFW